MGRNPPINLLTQENSHIGEEDPIIGDDNLYLNHSPKKVPNKSSAGDARKRRKGGSRSLARLKAEGKAERKRSRKAPISFDDQRGPC